MFVYVINSKAPVIDWVFEFNHIEPNKEYKNYPKDMIRVYNTEKYAGYVLVYKYEGKIKRRKFWLTEYDMDKATRMAEEYFKNKKHQTTLEELLNEKEGS